MNWCSVFSVRRLHVSAFSVALGLGLSACGDDGGGGDETVADAGPDGGSSDSTGSGSTTSSSNSSSNSSGGNSTTPGNTSSGGGNTTDDESSSEEGDGGSGGGTDTSGQGSNSSAADCGALGEICCGMGFGAAGTCDDGLECDNPAGMGLANSECVTPGSEGDGGETSADDDAGETTSGEGDAGEEACGAEGAQCCPGQGGQCDDGLECDNGPQQGLGDSECVVPEPEGDAGEEACGAEGEGCCGAAFGTPGTCDDGLECDTGASPGPGDNVCVEPVVETDAGEEACGGEGEGCCGAAFGVDGTCDDGLECDTGGGPGPGDNVCVEPVVEMDAGAVDEEDASTTGEEETDASTTGEEATDAGVEEVDASDAGDGA
jgi:hypothetical protein